MIIFDTDLLIGALRGNPRALAFVAAHEGEGATTTLNAGELFEGAELSDRAQEGRVAIEVILAAMPMIGFGPKHARTYGKLSAARRRSGRTGGVIDLQIASIAVTEGAQVATRNERDFEGHEGLRLIPW